MLWKQIVPAFNEICGNDFDKEKLDRALKRIKMNTNLKAHALLYDENDDNHTICRIKDERSDEFGINYTQDETDQKNRRDFLEPASKFPEITSYVGGEDLSLVDRPMLIKMRVIYFH